MLAAELMHFAIRTMWDETRELPRSGRDEAPLWPFALNCEAACVLDRLATLTGDAAYHDRACAILSHSRRNIASRTSWVRVCARG